MRAKKAEGLFTSQPCDICGSDSAELLCPTCKEAVHRAIYAWSRAFKHPVSIPEELHSSRNRSVAAKAGE